MNFQQHRIAIFIEPTLDDYQTLTQGCLNGSEIVILDADKDGIAQISDYLSKKPQISSLHIVSHGAPANLYLGNSILSLDTINHYQKQLSEWSVKEIYLYGCHVAVGDAGEEFVTKLHEITGAAIAASKTITGNAKLGGDWNLEATRGAISSSSEVFSESAKQAYSGLLGTYTVNTLEDQDDGKDVNGISLRDAMEAADSNPDTDTIVFDPSLDGQTITLTQGTLDSSNPVTIIGNKFNPISISGNNSYRVFKVYNATLNGLKIINGDSYSGSGIYGKNLTLINSSVLNNTASSNGGGLYLTGGTNKIINSTIANNNAEDGGGIYNYDAITNIINSTISSNSATDSGGGLYNHRGVFNIANSTVTQNIVSGGTGAGLYNSRETTTVVNSIIAGNIDNVITGSFGSDIDSSTEETNNIVSLGNNLIGNGTAVNFFSASGDQTGVTNPLLSPLTDNGGAVLTHALLKDSPALNTGNNASIALDVLDLDGDGNKAEQIPFDQTGNTRILEDIVNIGAVETDGQVINGDGNNNFLSGTESINKIYGFDGNDTLKGLKGDDLLDGGKGKDLLKGGKGNDILQGKGGKDKLIAGSGDDVLVGGSSKDLFIYKGNSSSLGVDTISDFTVDLDKLVLSQKTFTTIDTNPGKGLNASEFASVNTDELAASSEADIVYNTGNGKLFYNENGAAEGLGTGAEFAVLTNLAALSATDFQVIA